MDQLQVAGEPTKHGLAFAFHESAIVFSVFQ
jgi:hypothetical protein